MSSESGIDALSEGAVLGKYRITKKLGEGGMGVVYAAMHERLGRPVAVKVLRAGMSKNLEQSSRFQMEAELVTRIGHPNIVQVYDFGRLPDDSLYFVMEMIKGESLRDRLLKKPLSDQEVVQVFGPLLSALRAAHGIGVVHRDLKPDNVMLLEGEGDSFSSIKLLDFGIAKIRGEDAAPVAAAVAGAGAEAGAVANPATPTAAVTGTSGGLGIDALKTAAGAIMGTPAYMAPEQIKNSSKVDKRADIYAIGIMLYEVLAGRRPFNGGFGELIGQHLFQPPDSPTALAKENNMPPRQINWPKVEAVVMRMLAKEPDDRYQDCASLQAALDEAWGQSFSQVQTKTLSAALPIVAPPKPKAPARPRGVVVAAAAAVVVLGIGGFLGIRAMQKPSVQQKQRHPRAIARYEAAQKGSASDRRLLMEAIESAGGRQHLSAVAAALSDEDPTVSRAAISAALQIAQPSDTTIAEALAAQEGQEVGINSSDIAALRLRIGETDAEATLLSTLKSPLAKPEARLRAALALAEAGRLPGPSLRQTLEETMRAGPLRPMLRRETMIRLVILNEPEALKQLNAIVEDKTNEARPEALGILAIAQHAGSFDRLYDAAVWVRGADRLLLAEALAEAGDKRASQLLKPFVKEPEPKVRRRAVAALGRMANAGRLPDYIALFESLLDDSDPKVAMLATISLIQ